MPESWVARVTRPFAAWRGQRAGRRRRPQRAARRRGFARGPVAPAPPATAVPAARRRPPAPRQRGGAAPAVRRGASTAPIGAAVSATAAQGIDEVLAHVAAAPNIPLQVIASADSWVEVVDAQGHSLLSRTVVAGESVGLDGALPMRVKIGNAEGTHLKLRGDNVDLTPWTHDNVARLEVK